MCYSSLSLSLPPRSSRPTSGERTGFSAAVTVVVCSSGTSGVVGWSTCSWLTLMSSTVFSLILMFMVNVYSTVHWHSCQLFYEEFRDQKPHPHTTPILRLLIRCNIMTVQELTRVLFIVSQVPLKWPSYTSLAALEGVQYHNNSCLS